MEKTSKLGASPARGIHADKGDDGSKRLKEECGQRSPSIHHARPSIARKNSQKKKGAPSAGCSQPIPREKSLLFSP